MDSDCPSKLACFSGYCKNPCIETKPCGKNAECSVVDTLPLRTMSCSCLPGYVGDADVECRGIISIIYYINSIENHLLLIVKFILQHLRISNCSIDSILPASLFVLFNSNTYQKAFSNCKSHLLFCQRT